jgi:diguanylate cyclase (GGDEF)-like protein/PAS domain S-box-containing protein
MPSRFFAVVLYLVLAAIWIFFSDRLLLNGIADAKILSAWQTAKGTVFVALNAALLYWLIGRYAARPPLVAGAPQFSFRLARWPAAIFLASLLLGAALIAKLEGVRVEQKRSVAFDRAVDHGHALQVEIDRALSSTYSLAAVIRQGKGRIDNFEALAGEMLPLHKGVARLALAREGVVSHIVPLSGAEAMLGVNLFADPAKRNDALAAEQSGQLSLAGPIQLQQGGAGLVGRLPVFIGREENARFWGFAIAVLRADDLLKAANLLQMRSAGYEYELKSVAPLSGEPKVLARSAHASLVDPVHREVEVPNGRWTLSVAPLDGWHSYPELTIEALMVVLLSALLAYLTHTLLRQPVLLQREVASRTQELADANLRLENEVAERRRAQDSLKRLNRALRVLSQGNGALVRSPDEATLLGDVCAILVESGGYCLAWAGVLDSERKALRTVTMVPNGSAEAERLGIEQDDSERWQSFVGKAFREGRPVLSVNVPNDPFYGSIVDSDEAEYRQPGVALPLGSAGEIFGVLVLHSRDRYVFDADETAILLELADDVGYGIAALRTRQARLAAAAQLADSEERFRAITASAQDAIVMIDARGLVCYWNPAAERIFGYSSEEALGRDVHGLIAVDSYREAANNGLATFGETGRGPIVGKLCELEARRRDGSVFPIELAISAMSLHGQLHAVGVVRDISARRQSEEALSLRERAIEASGEGIMISAVGQLDHPFIYVNPAFERITGVPAADALGRNGRFLLGEDADQEGLEEIRLALRERREGRAVLRSRRKDGRLLWNELSVSPVRSREGRVTHFVSVMHDVTERKLYEEQLEHQANYDQLTGLANRNLLADRLEQAIAHAARGASEVAVLVVNLDNFKVVNDSLGQAPGDQLLQAVASRLTACVRDGDTVARVGGDEFVLVLPAMPADDVIELIEQRIPAGMAMPFPVDGKPVTVTLSIGISLYPRDGSDRQTLLKNAHAAMHAMKRHGRNGFRFFTSEMNQRVHERLTMDGELRKALANEELVVYYQPQVDLHSGRIVGAEALVRWQHPDRGMVPPMQFIPMAEETGLIIPISEWILRTACRQQQAWLAVGLPVGRIGVNLSPRQLTDGDLVGLTRRVLDESGLSPSLLEFELTESMAMRDVEQAIRILKNLKDIGVRASLDDFGTGHSSLSYLQLFSVAALKIDRMFVSDVAANPHNAVIVSTIIAMAHKLGLRVIAEGVETLAELSYLRGQRCDEMQGFHFSRPLPAAAYEALLRAQTLQTPSPEGDATGRTLLLVDDEPNVVGALLRLFRRDGYRILTANSGREGLDLLALNPVQVILSDQRMPVMSGTEFFQRVKQVHPDTIRIVLSGYTDLQSVTDAINQGAIYKFLTKPWDDDALRDTIKQAFRMHESKHSPQAAG